MRTWLKIVLMIFTTFLAVQISFAQWGRAGENPFYQNKKRSKTQVGGFFGLANIQDFTKWDPGNHNQTNVGHLRLFMINRFDRYNTLVSSLQTRFFYSNDINTSSFAQDLKQQNNLVPLTWVVHENESSLLHTELDVLFYQYKNKNFQFRLGKQRYNWSQSWIWSANNYQNTYSVLGFDIDNRSAVESISAKYDFDRNSTWSVEVSSVPRKQLDNSIHSARLLYKKGGNQFQVVGGMVLKDFSVGTGGRWAIDKTKDFFGEVTYFKPRNTDNSSEAFIVDLTYLQVINRRILLVGEVAYHSNPTALVTSPDVFTEINVKNIINDKFQASLLWRYHLNKKVSYGLSSQYFFTHKDADLRAFLQIDFTKKIQLYSAFNAYNIPVEDFDFNLIRKQWINQLIIRF
jgi:hypothetical protein